ncbi:MAG: muconolactone delta-isomerase [Rhodobacteraceae bacterium CG17_big_fil_post_rev_8_21_14_2_50_65_11]|nr:MAG: muconolactone delta-isomerase [Rhodobacteraceae bacterium CG17_big_fil_post_rev_8_21_14_2_50_65_11]
MEFLVNITLRWPPDLGDEAKAPIIADERARAAQLAASGHLVRIWRVPGRFENWGLWRAADATELHELLTSLPAHPWITHVDVIPLASHPSDPASHGLRASGGKQQAVKILPAQGH